MTPDTAETIALRCLAWLAGNDELLPVFLGATGASEADLRARAGDGDFLVSVLEFLTMDDAWVLACAEAQGFEPTVPMEALAVLHGESRRHWT